MNVRIWAATCAVVLFAAGCGSRVAPSPGGEARAVTEVAEPDLATGSRVPTESSTPVAGEPGDSTVSGSVPVQETAGTGSKYGPAHNNGVVKLALSAECVAPGSLLVVTITAPAKAGLGMVIGYSDHQAHGAMLTGETDSRGMYTWRVPVDPTVPEGEARVLVSASGPEWSRKGGGTADKIFRVAKAGC